MSASKSTLPQWSDDMLRCYLLGLERFPGEGRGYPLQYSGLENSRDYTVHGVAKSWRRLSLPLIESKLTKMWSECMCLKYVSDQNETVQAFYYQETSLVCNHTWTFLPRSEEVVLNYLCMKTTQERVFSNHLFCSLFFCKICIRIQNFRQQTYCYHKYHFYFIYHQAVYSTV